MSTLTTLAKGGTLSRRSWLYWFLAQWYGDAKAGSFRDTCQLRGALFLPTLVVLLVSGVIAFVTSRLVNLVAISVDLRGAPQTFLNLGSLFLTSAGIAVVIIGAILALTWFLERIPKIGIPFTNVLFGALVLAGLVIIAFFAVTMLGDAVVGVVSPMAPEFARYELLLSDHPVWAGAVGLAAIFLVIFSFFLVKLILKGIGRAWNSFWSLEERVAVIAWIKGRLCKRITYVRF